MDCQKLFNNNRSKPAQRPNGCTSESGGELQDTTTAVPTADAAGENDEQVASTAEVLNKMTKIQLRRPSFSFGALIPDLKDRLVHCFPIADRRVLCVDKSGGALRLDADDTRQLVTMPRLHKPSQCPSPSTSPAPTPTGTFSVVRAAASSSWTGTPSRPSRAISSSASPLTPIGSWYANRSRRPTTVTQRSRRSAPTVWSTASLGSAYPWRVSDLTVWTRRATRGVNWVSGRSPSVASSSTCPG